ncbi:hypothetical protein Salat_0846900 [Sesamum alatum]|uniref:Uncharacterized protein n=1 Tax=Sesamum alatum TaxID=300844 RepID=A0AAE2CQI9_9LAMI|nr:hypothetical protein Salat_0846900 [Sesamum alatum]
MKDGVELRAIFDLIEVKLQALQALRRWMWLHKASSHWRMELEMVNSSIKIQSTVNPTTDLDSLNLAGTLPQTRWYGGPPSIVIFPPTPEPYTLGPNPSISSIEPPNPFNHTTPSIASLDSSQKNILIYSPTPYGISLSTRPTKGS